MGELHAIRGHRLAAVDHGVGGQRVVRADRVEDAKGLRLGEPDHPFAQVAAIDDLDRILAIARHQHLAALRHSQRPIGETVGLVARADDVAGSDNGAAFAVMLAHLGLAQRLQRTVEILHVGTQAFLRFRHRVLALVDGQWRIFIDAVLAAIGIDGDRRDEHVVADVALQHLGRVAHPERQAGGVVDAHVPLAPLQRFQVGRVAVAEELLDLARPFRRRSLAAVEQGHLVPARQRVVDLERAGEAGAAEDEDVQRFGRFRNRRRCHSRQRERGHRRGGGGQRTELEQVPTRAAHVHSPRWMSGESRTPRRVAPYGESRGAVGNARRVPDRNVDRSSDIDNFF